jgi:hypothetical protein
MGLAKKPVITTDKLVHGMFFQIDRVRKTNGDFRVTCHPTADSGVRSITMLVAAERARELGFAE